jgi:hypothetical protein
MISLKLLQYNIQGDQEGLFQLVIPNFIFNWYNWSNLCDGWTLTAASLTSDI